MSGDEVSTGELRRAMEDLRKSVDKLSNNVERIGVIEWRVGAVEARQTEMEKSAITDQAQRRMDRRLIFTALIAPAIIVIFQLWWSSRGGTV